MFERVRIAAAMRTESFKTKEGRGVGRHQKQHGDGVSTAAVLLSTCS